MPSDWEDEDGLPEGDEGLPEMRRPASARPRSGPTRAQILRRRLTAIAAIVVVGVAVVIVLTSTGESEGQSAGKAAADTTKKTTEKPKPESHAVTNATPQADWKPYTGPVPILEYHVLGAPPEGAPYPELYVGRTDFEKQMDWLEEHGYEAVTLEQVQEA